MDVTRKLTARTSRRHSQFPVLLSGIIVCLRVCAMLKRTGCLASFMQNTRTHNMLFNEAPELLFICLSSMHYVQHSHATHRSPPPPHTATVANSAFFLERSTVSGVSIMLFVRALWCNGAILERQRTRGRWREQAMEAARHTHTHPGTHIPPHT